MAAPGRSPRSNDPRVLAHRPAGPMRIIIIGGGFGGIGLGIALKKAGIQDFVILERAQDVGGVWRDNTYPGAACDIASRLYSYSHDRAYEWSTAYAPQAEILRYIKECVARHGIGEHIRVSTEVASAQFDDAAAIWRVITTDGRELECNVLISAVGIFGQLRIPEFLGRSEFRGPQFHSARWDHNCGLKGKRVAVIGNGASAVQFVPHVAHQAAEIHLYQRTPQHVMPKSTFPGSSKWDVRLQRHRWLRWLVRLKIYMTFERNLFRRIWLPKWGAKATTAFARLLEVKVTNENLRRKLVPSFPLGCKRPLASDEWFGTLQRSNVEVITDAIARIVPTGIRTADGTTRPADVIIYATGFTTTAYLSPMRIAGTGGRDLKDAWREGAEAYLGIAVPRFPNFFILYGPNTNAPDVIFMLECQAQYIVQCLNLMNQKSAVTMSVSQDAHRRFAAEMERRLAKTAIANASCHSNFKQEDGRITVAWPGLSTEYWFRTRRVIVRDFKFSYR